MTHISFPGEAYTSNKEDHAQRTLSLRNECEIGTKKGRNETQMEVDFPVWKYPY